MFDMYEGWIGLFMEPNGVWKWSTDSGKHEQEGKRLLYSSPASVLLMMPLRARTLSYGGWQASSMMANSLALNLPQQPQTNTTNISIVIMCLVLNSKPYWSQLISKYCYYTVD